MKYTVNVNGQEVGVSKEVYVEYRRNTPRARHERYIASESKKHEIPLTESTQLFSNPSAEDEFIKYIELNELAGALNKLSKEEKEIIQEIYSYGTSERALAQKYGVYRNAIHERKQVILKKLKKVLDSSCAKHWFFVYKKWRGK